MHKRLNDIVNGLLAKAGPAVPTAVQAGIIVSLFAGFADLTVDITAGQTGGVPAGNIILSLAVTTILFFVLYMLLWALAVAPLGRLVKLKTAPLAVSFGLFVGAAFLLALLNGLITFSYSSAALLKLVVLLGFAAAGSALSYFIILALEEMPDYSETAARLAVVAPVLIAEYDVTAILSLPSLLTGVAFLAFAWLTVYFSLRQGRTASTRMVSFIFASLLVLAPVLVVVNPAPATAMRKTAFQLDEHRVKRVILITIDTLRADFISADVRSAAATPHLDALANDGIVFTRVISPAPWTLPSLSSLMTGLSPEVHMTKMPGSILPDNVVTLAEYMHGGGYYTGAIVYNPYLKISHGLAQGFDDYDVYPKSLIGGSFGAAILKKALPERFRQTTSTTQITDSALAWLKSNRGRDFFLWLHYLDPHIPYAPPAEFLPKGKVPPRIGIRFDRASEIQSGHFSPTQGEREWIRGLYQGEVLYMDRSIGRLLESLKQLGLYQDSLILLTADHGEEFWEHNSIEHGHSLFNELLHVPLIIKLPESTFTGRIDTLVQTHSVMPTVLDLCGIRYAANRLSTSSLVPLWGKTPQSFDEHPVVSSSVLRFEDREALTLNHMKYIHYLVSSHEELYDLSSDPSEQYNIANKNPEFLQKARTVLKQYHANAQDLRDYYQIEKATEIKLDQKTIQELKSLGYVR